MSNFSDSEALVKYRGLDERYKKIKAENEALRTELEKCKHTIDVRFDELATLTKLLEARNHQIFLATSACMASEGKLLAMKESFSWKATKLARTIFKSISKRRGNVKSSQYIRYLIEKSSYFDSDWYVSHHPEVSGSGLIPIQYFVDHGLAKWHDPGPNFSCDKYIGKYPDVAISGIPPFLHFIRHGLSEGRDSI
ncbi:hypothetical protein [Burkholderia sp. WTPI3]|uniref:hypothetical protein n=1 Tax=Burkholderia sp. WTPI3 TaxID=2822167 RepID=UPI001F270BF9|nr:hypothetical protein [Burkholderia sp. WTPI3]